MANCVACGGKAKEKRIELDFCRICGINFDNRIQSINDSTDIDGLENAYSKAVKAVETRDKFNDENRQKVINHFKTIYESQKEKFKNAENEKSSSGLIYEVKGIRGRSLEVYQNKVVIRTSITLGSVITGNATDGKKTIYFQDVIGLQFKPSGALIGYLQLETAAPTMNNEKSNFYNENTFTFDETSTTNRLMLEIENYIDKRLEDIKCHNNSSSADEIKKFKELLNDQAITQEEYEAKKKQLLNI